MNFCLNCGSKLPLPTCHFCPYCGFDLRPYLNQPHQGPEVVTQAPDAHVMAQPAPHPAHNEGKKAEASSTNLGEEVRNLKENMVSSEPNDTTFDAPVKEVEPQKAVVEHKEQQTPNNEDGLVDEKIADLQQPAKMPTRSRKPLKDISKPEEVVSDVQNEKAHQEADDVVSEPDPDPDIEEPDHETKPADDEGQHIVVEPDEVDLDQDSNNDESDVPDLDQEVNVEDEKPNVDEVNAETQSSSSKAETPAQPTEAVADDNESESTDEETPAVELPNTSNVSNDLGDEYATSNDSTDTEPTPKASHPSETDSEVDDASALLNQLRDEDHKQDQKRKGSPKADKSKPQVTEPDDFNKYDSDDKPVADVDNALNELPDEYAPKSSETDPNKTTTIIPDSDVQDSLYREKQSKPKVHRPFDRKEARTTHKPSKLKQKSYSKMNFGF